MKDIKSEVKDLLVMLLCLVVIAALFEYDYGFIAGIAFAMQWQLSKFMELR